MDTAPHAPKCCVSIVFLQFAELSRALKEHGPSALATSKSCWPPRPQGTAARVNVRATVEEQLAHGQVPRLRQETLAPSPYGTHACTGSAPNCLALDLLMTLLAGLGGLDQRWHSSLRIQLQRIGLTSRHFERPTCSLKRFNLTLQALRSSLHPH